MSTLTGRQISDTYKQIVKLGVSANRYIVGLSLSLFMLNWVDRDNPTIYLWPIPENSTDILNIEGIRALEDVNKSADQNADMPKRFLPPLTCGLSYYLSMKTPGTPPDRIGMLKSNYEQLLKTAMEEDRERANLFIRPKLGYIWWQVIKMLWQCVIHVDLYMHIE